MYLKSNTSTFFAYLNQTHHQPSTYFHQHHTSNQSISIAFLLSTQANVRLLLATSTIHADLKNFSSFLVTARHTKLKLQNSNSIQIPFFFNCYSYSSNIHPLFLCTQYRSNIGFTPQLHRKIRTPFKFHSFKS